MRIDQRRRLAPRRAAHPAHTPREEFLNTSHGFESPEAAQRAVDGWVSGYNYQ